MLVRKHKVKTEVLSKIDEKIKQKRIKVKPNKKISGIFAEL